MTQSDYYRGSRVKKTKPPTASQLPAQVVNVSASDATDAFVTITWDAAARASGYQVYRSAVSGQTGSLLASLAALSLVDTTAAIGQVYYYSVLAANSYGNGPISIQDAGSVETPVVPADSPAGQTYYVSAAGNNLNAGTIDAPWRTLAKVNSAKAIFRPGDSILLNRGDTWLETFNITSIHGDDGSQITFGAYGSGALPVVDAENIRDWCIYTVNCTYVTIQDIKVQNAVYDGVRLVASVGDSLHIIYNRMSSTGCGRYGFSAESTLTGLQLDEIEYWDCVETLTKGNASTGAGFFAYHFSGRPTGIHYHRCKSTYSGQTGISHGFSAFVCDTVFYDQCESAYTGIDPGTGLPNLYNATAEGHGFCYDDLSSSGVITNCFSHHNAGAGIVLAHQGSNNVCAYNVVSHNGKYGLVVNGTSAGANDNAMYNNTIHSNGGPGIQVWSPVNVVTIKNNIIAGNSGYGIAFSSSGITGPVVSTNVIFNNTAGATSSVSGAVGTITTDPQCVNPSADDFSLQSGSSAIDVGLNLGTTYHLGLDPTSSWPAGVLTLDQNGSGADWEIGAYVYVP